MVDAGEDQTRPVDSPLIQVCEMLWPQVYPLIVYI